MCQRINLLKNMNIFVAVKSVKCLFDIILFFIIHLFISIYMQDYFKIFSISILFHTFILIIMIINMIDLCIFTIESFIVAFCDVHESSQNLHHLSHHLHPCGVRLFCFRVHILRHEHICKYMCTKNFFKRHVLEV